MLDPSILPLVFVSDFFCLVFVSDGHEKKKKNNNFLETVCFLSGENFHAHSASQCASFEHNTRTNVSTVFEKMKFSCHKISPPLVVLSDHTFLRSLFWYNGPPGERELGYVSRPMRVSGEDFNYSFFRAYTAVL